MNPSPLTPGQIERALAELPGWAWDRNVLGKTWQFEGMRAAMTFVHRATFIAEQMGHHPRWTCQGGTVRVGLCTREAGDRVTARDIELARRFENLFRAR